MSRSTILLLRKRFLGLVISMICSLLFVLFILNYTKYKIATYQDPTSIDLTINFLLPMEQDPFSSKISIVPENPSTKISYKTKWINNSTVVLRLKQQGLPHGQLLTVKINQAPTRIPFITKNFKCQIRPQVPVYLISAPKLNSVSSRGPVPVTFNTPIDLAEIEKFVKLPVPGELKPVKLIYQGKNYVDYSSWQFIPHNPFRYNTDYELIISSGLTNKSGGKLENTKRITFRAPFPPKVLSTYPVDGAANVPLYKNIEATLERDILKGRIKVTDLKTKKLLTGIVEIKDDKIVFKPTCCFLPGRQYRVELNLKTKNYEPLENYRFSFTTLKMNETYWLDVKVGNKHTVTVYKGDKIVRHMLASGGRPETPTPLGLFYTQDRGHSFWSPRFGEGATYWVRLVGQVLIHSVPRNGRWEIKKDEHEKLGLPASHGCIRLDEKDAKWVFENIPRGTLVIIHI